MPITWFLILSVLVSTVFWAPIIGAGRLGAGAGNYVTGLMWAPAVAAVLTVHITGSGGECLALRWGGARYALLGYAIPFAYGAIAYGLIWMLAFGTFAEPESIARIAQRMGWDISSPAVVVPLYVVLMGTTQIILNLARAPGEEIGWRGFLAPLLVARLGFIRGSVVTGILWAAWHMPLFYFAGYNGGTQWWVSMPCFFVMVIGLSIVLSWLRLASNSVWPCAILHASHNLFIQGVFTPLTGPRGSTTNYVIGEFGVAVPLIVLLFALACSRLVQPIGANARQNVVTNA